MMGEVRIRVLGGKDSPAPAKSHRVGELFTPERRGPAARYRGGRKDGMRVNTRFTALTRLGFAARGLLYIVIALLVFRSGRSEDIGGALAELGRSGGDPLLLAIAAGFIAYGLWRLADAALDLDGHDAGAKGARQRLAAVGSGTIYLMLAWQAIRLIAGDRLIASNATEQASTALQMPGGPLLLIAAGAILVGAGLFQLVLAYECRFCERLDPEIGNRPSVRFIGRAGYSARGVIFMLSGYFIVRAGLDARASEAGGMEEALRWLDPPVDLIVAAGLLLFGLFSILEARFRVISDVPLDEAARVAAQTARS